jgi:hypothetical protein
LPLRTHDVTTYTTPSPFGSVVIANPKKPATPGTMRGGKGQ